MVDRFKISIEEDKSNMAKGSSVKKYLNFSLKYYWSRFALIFGLVLLMLSIFYYAKSSKPLLSIKVNFQDSVTIPPSGWLSDYGQPFGPRTSSNQGNGKTFGWIKSSDKTPFDLTKNGRKRNSPSNILLATFIIMQGKNINNSTGAAEDGIWEARVANGNYDVTVSVGDGAYTDSRHSINVEGVSVISGFVPTDKVRFKSATVTISVSDGYLTIDANGGVQTKINTVTISPSHSKRPSITGVNPDNGSENVSENTSISASILKLRNRGINNATLTSSSVYLTEDKTGFLVPSHVNGTVGDDTITLVPDSPLKLSTAYRFTITSKVKDLSDSSFIPYSSTFTTGSGSTSAIVAARFDKVNLPYTSGQHSSLTIGPDGKLYALTLDGIIKRFSIHSDGILSPPELLYSLQDAYGTRTERLAIGFTFDPSSTATNLIAWISHSTFVFEDAPDWDGKLTRLNGPSLENVQDVLVNLPRSTKDHLTNSIAFGPDGALYISQGSNTAMGSSDNIWGSREENLLSGSILRLDVLKTRHFPLDVKTSEGGGNYNPYSPSAPLTIYASGIRNAYDFVWHSNGSLYVPANGSAAGGNTPASVKGALRPDGSFYKGTSVPALSYVGQTEKDFLFRVVKGGYYGHPNPLRGEYVMNGGNPTFAIDRAEISRYPLGTLPDANWRGYSFDFHNNTSPNGVIEYKSNAFKGALKGKLLIVRYSKHDDIITLTPGGQNNDIISAVEGYSIKGFSGFIDPLDLTEDTKNGNIYVSQFGAGGKIILLRPADNAITYKSK